MLSRSRSVTLSQGTSAVLAVAAIIAAATNTTRGQDNLQSAQTGKEMGKGQYANVNGLRMYYEIHGSGRPLVLLHGSFGTAETWNAVLPALVKNRQVIILEQQGHGHTADREGPLTYEQMVDDTAGLLKQLNIKGADILGYSLGGILALGVGIHHPEVVGRLAVLGANTGNLKEAFEAQTYAQFQSIPADFAPSVLKEPYDRMAPDKTKWPVLVRKIKDLGLGSKGYSPSEVRSIKAPTLIMLGDRDGTRPEHAVEMLRLIPNAQLAIFPGADHFLLFTGPDKVLGTLLPFLDQQATTGR